MSQEHSACCVAGRFESRPVGRSVPNCELFGGRSGYREPVGDSRHTRDGPQVFDDWRLVSRSPTLPTRPMTLAFFMALMALRICEDKTQRYDEFAPSLSRPRIRGRGDTELGDGLTRTKNSVSPPGLPTRRLGRHTSHPDRPSRRAALLVAGSRPRSYGSR